MAKKIIFSLFFPLLFMSNLAQCIEDVDFSGSTMIHRGYERITDDSVSKRHPDLEPVNWLCNELSDKRYQKAKRLNLANNIIGDEGAKQIAHFLKKRHLPNLRKLDLSFNAISERGIRHFSSLLQREKFEYLIIYGNNGAASQEGRNNLTSRLLRKLDKERVKECLEKVIWIPESRLEKEKRRHSSSCRYIRAHKQYYEELYQ